MSLPGCRHKCSETLAVMLQETQYIKYVVLIAVRAQSGFSSGPVCLVAVGGFLRKNVFFACMSGY